MNELMIERTTDAIDTLRFKSRFDEFNEERFYKDATFSFPSGLMGTDGALSVSISCESTRYGIRKPVGISYALYRDWINQRSCLTLQRIGVLCHAFLYAVDLDQHNAHILVFPVPFFTQGVGFTPVQVQAQLIGGKNQWLYFDLA